MTDLEMTKLCAEAMGMDEAFVAEMYWRISPDRYDPLHYDSQTMALIKKIGINCMTAPFKNWVVRPQGSEYSMSVHGSDLNRAVVECVAKMQAEKNAATAHAATSKEIDL